MLCRCTPKLDGSKISNIPIDRVYPIYVHYGKFKGKPTYPDSINLYLQDTQVFSCICFNNSLPHSCEGLLGFSKCEWEKKRKNMKRENMKSEGTIWRENEKSFAKCEGKVISPISAKESEIVVLIRKHFLYFLKS